MPYYLSTFDGEVLSGNADALIGETNDVGTGEAMVSFWPLASGGGLDGYGTSDAPVGVVTVSTSGQLSATNESTLLDNLNALKALHRRRAKLTRFNPASAANEFTYARLVKIPAERNREEPFTVDLSLVFELLIPFWFGLPHGEDVNATDNKFTLNVSPKTITVTNDGNAEIGDAAGIKIAITNAVGAADITNILIEIADFGVSLEWTGVLEDGETLVIDSGAHSVTIGSDSAYDDFDPWDNAIDDWLRLNAGPAGTTDIVITRTGGNASATVQVSYYDTSI